MPDQNQPKAPAFNPKLKDAIAALKAENNPQNLNVVLNELVRSPLLAPANFDLQGQPAPTPGPDGRVQLPPNTKINLIMVNSPEGKHYYLGFSDWDAVHEWQKNPEAAGMVINPGENSLRLERPLIESVKKQRDEIAKALAQQRAAVTQIKPGDKVTIVEPSVLPDELADPICKVLAEAPGVGSAYLQIMIINDEAKSYLLVLDGPKDDKLFAAVAQAARPYLLSREKKIDLNITTSISPLGQQGMRGSEPFYRKGIGRVIEEDDDE